MTASICSLMFDMSKGGVRMLEKALGGGELGAKKNSRQLNIACIHREESDKNGAGVNKHVSSQGS